MSTSEEGDRGPKTPFEEALDHITRGTTPDVGYGKPPLATRFKKGQSGNPKGRPKAAFDRGDRSSHGIALREADRLVTVREGEETREITQIELVHRQQYITATKGGSAYAQKHIIERHERARRERRREIEAECEIWRRYVADARHHIQAAVKSGTTVPPFLPHPDDVVIDVERGVRFIGPWDEDSAARMEDALKVRDVMIMQDVWDNRSGRGEGDSDITVAGVVATMLNTCVPARFQLSDHEYIDRQRRYQITTKRELRKLLLRRFRELGLRWKGGRMLPSLAAYIERWTQLAENINELERAR